MAKKDYLRLQGYETGSGFEGGVDEGRRFTSYKNLKTGELFKEFEGDQVARPKGLQKAMQAATDARLTDLAKAGDIQGLMTATGGDFTRVKQLNLLPGADWKQLGEMGASYQASQDKGFMGSKFNQFLVGAGALLAGGTAINALSGTAAAGAGAFPMPPAGTVAPGGFAMPAAIPVTPLSPAVTGLGLGELPAAAAGAGAAGASGGASSGASAVDAGGKAAAETATATKSTIATLKDVATLLTPVASLAASASSLSSANKMSDIALSPPVPTPAPIFGGPNTILATRAAASEQLRRRGRASTILTSPQSETLGA